MIPIARVDTSGLEDAAQVQLQLRVGLHLLSEQPVEVSSLTYHSHFNTSICLLRSVVNTDSKLLVFHGMY